MPQIKYRLSNLAIKALMLIIATLLMVWPLPGTVALRYALAGMLSVTLIGLSFKARMAKPIFQTSGLPALCLLALSFWILVQAAIISPFPEKAFAEIGGQWLKALVFFFMGIYAGGLSINQDTKWAQPLLVLTVFVVVASQVLMLLGDDLYLFLHEGFIPYHWARLTGGHKAAMSNICSVFILMIAADVGSRLSISKRLLPLPGWVLALMGSLGLIATWILSARNGVISLAVICLVTVGLTTWLRRVSCKKMLLASLTVVAAVGLFGMLTYKSDARWQKFSESLEKGLALDESWAWVKPAKYPYPKMSNGEQVDVSAYERTAWLKSGIIFASEYPWGIGYDRGAYGRARFLNYGEDARAGMGDHSHSSMIDLAIGIGLPGAILWLTFLLLLIRAGWQGVHKNQQPAGNVLILLAMVYMVGSFVDSNVRDHMLEEFMFLAGVFLMVSKCGDKGLAYDAN